MSIKTCVVFLKFKVGQQLEYTETSENGVFGPDCEFATANDFIEEVRKLHRKSNSDMKITNVVIG